MELEITLPEEIAVMTLPKTAFFPQALLPLHIFEPRYQQMLKESLQSHRLFAVAGLDSKMVRESTQFEPSYPIATVGIVRACQKAENGTSNLLLQGLARVRILKIVREYPYRIVRFEALSSQAGATVAENARLRQSLGKLILAKQKLGGDLPDDLTQFLTTVDDPETFVDLAAFSLCQDVGVKQRLLATLNVNERLQLFAELVRKEIAALKLRRKLQGELSDDSVSDN